MEFKSFDNKKIYIHEWLEVDAPNAIVQIIHGMAEHAGRYEKFAKFLNENGYLVVADDHRGHGKTDSETLGFCEGDMFEDTVHDEGEITKYYKEKYPNLKYFVFGFSYGSFITQSYIGKYGELIDGAVIAGSNKKKDYEVYLGSIVTGIFNFFGNQSKPSKLIERLSFGIYSKKFPDREWGSDDKENNKRYKEDKFCGFTCSNRFYADFFKGLKSLYTKTYKNSLRKDLPLLLMAGKNDPVGDMGKGMENLYEFYTKEVGIRDVELNLLDGYRHEFIQVENNQEDRFREVLTFFENH
ncbi:MAG: alpha/beta hydrolase [Clostridia bacterium]